MVIHPNRNRLARTWPSERWRELALGLLERGVGVVAVGRDVPNLAGTEENVPKGVFDLGIGHGRFLDLTGRTSLHELCEVIAASDVAVTFDSGVLHVANCTETPARGAVQRQRPRLLHPHPQRQTGRRHRHRPSPLPDAVLPNMARGMERMHPGGRPPDVLPADPGTSARRGSGLSPRHAAVVTPLGQQKRPPSREPFLKYVVPVTSRLFCASSQS